MLRASSRRLSVKSRLGKLTGGSVDFQPKNNIGFIRINNPEKFNALTGSMMLDFSKVMDEVEKFDGTAIVLTGEGKAFCSGSDLSCLSEFGTSEDGILMSDFMHQVTNRLYANDNQLTVSFINGPAFGGGSELATATDLRIASPKAKLATVHKNLALQPGWAGATRLVRLVGAQNALYMLSTAKVFNAQQLVDIGFCVPEIIEDIEDWTENHLSSIDRNVVRVMKSNAKNAVELSLHDAFREEKRNFGSLIGQPANVKAIAALKLRLERD